MVALDTTRTALGPLADAINEQHRQAVKHAERAIEHARKAGEMLLQVKAELRHGEFMQWLAANVAVSPRQAQRYMAVAQGRPLPVRRINATRASHLERQAATFEPVPDACMRAELPNLTFVVEQSQLPDYFWVSVLDGGRAFLDVPRRPVRSDAVELCLKLSGCPAPADVAWRITRGWRVAESFVERVWREVEGAAHA